MSRIFINYRRESASGHAGRLYDRLVAHFGRDQVYMDVDMQIPLGSNFVTYLREAVQRCDVMLVLIDRYWLTAVDPNGNRRLDNPADFVRLEIAIALGRDIPVIPVCTQGARHPLADALPSDLEELAYRQGLELSDLRFHYDVGQLIQALDGMLSMAAPVIPPAPTITEPGTFTNDLGMTFVRIPAGEFWMGAPDAEVEALIKRYPDSHREWFEREQPRHRVTISQPFYLGIHPVTQAQWEAVMGINPSRFGGQPDHPVEQVSWEEVQQFLPRLNARRDGHTYTLPSEAQWEYACHAGSSAAYCFGDEERQLGEYAWYGDNSGGSTHPVGQKKANAWGLYDMHGHVWEWVQDWYGPYAAEPVTDPRGPTAGTYRVTRGGSWGLPALDARSAYRIWYHPGVRVDDLGFRCLSSASEPESGGY